MIKTVNRENSDEYILMRVPMTWKQTKTTTKKLNFTVFSKILLSFLLFQRHSDSYEVIYKDFFLNFLKTSKATSPTPNIVICFLDQSDKILCTERVAEHCRVKVS